MVMCCVFLHLLLLLSRVCSSRRLLLAAVVLLGSRKGVAGVFCTLLVCIVNSVMCCFRLVVLLLFLMHKNLAFCSWNVRGLGHATRRDEVLAELISVSPTFAVLQETKLTSASEHKTASFLPSRLRQCVVHDSCGASGGLLTAWDESTCCLIHSSSRPYSLTCRFSLRTDSSEFTLTNIYAPANHGEKQAFFSELSAVARTVAGPWVLIGDFNLTRVP